jgi:rod shape-determining protein MreC
MAVYSMGRRRLIALLVLTSVLLITLDLRGSAIINRARSVFSLVIEPFDSAARVVSRPVINAWHGITHYDDLQKENDALRAQLDAQKGATVEARAAILEYQELLVLSQLLGSSNLPSVTVQVQGNSPGNFQNTVEINKGSLDHIQAGMPVINGGGLVGKVSQVFPHSSIVLLVVDPRFSLGAKVLTPIAPVPAPTTTTTTIAPDPAAAASSSMPTTTPTTTPPSSAPPPFTMPITTDPSAGPSSSVAQPGDPLAPLEVSTLPTIAPGTVPTTIAGAGATAVQRETGTVTGQGAGKPLVLRFIDDSSSTGRIAVGSTVQTAGGLRSIAPPGLPIGTVSKVSQPSGTRSPVIEVEISAGDLTRLNFLRVLLYVPNTSGA